MKIAQLMIGSSIDLENRKRALQRREMGEAYKKTQQYQSPKNPMLEALESLLSGKTERDLHATNQATREQDILANDEVKSYTEKKQQELQSTNGQSRMHQFEMTDKKVSQHDNTQKLVDGNELAIKEKEDSSSDGTLHILERVRAAALAPAEPSPQDLRVAAVATAQIQQTSAAISHEQQAEFAIGEVELFADAELFVEVPERFLNNFDQRDATKPSFFGRDLENLLQQRAFQKANAKYSSHIAMVKNGYRSFDEPLFSKTA